MVPNVENGMRDKEDIFIEYYDIIVFSFGIIMKSYADPKECYDILLEMHNCSYLRTSEKRGAHNRA